MSRFEVISQVVKEVAPAINSDNLEIVKFEDITWQVVAGKGNYTVGQRVLYIPLDSCLPEYLIAMLGLEGRLAKGGYDETGKKLLNRVKSIKLRGNMSEGLIVSEELLGFSLKPNHDYSEELQIKKHVEEEVVNMDTSLMPMPSYLSIYDIENLQKFPDVFEELKQRPVIITEKVEGSNWWATINRDGEIVVGQRKNAIKHNPQHAWYKAFYAQGLDELLVRLMGKNDVETITLRGEIIGPKIQGNYYKIAEHRIYVFDMMLNTKYIGAYTFDLFMQEYGVLTAPKLESNNFSTFTLDDALEFSNRQSLINPDKMAEGIVIKPTSEDQHEEIGRLMLKIRSPQYLEKNT
jgi:RNA ligase (TIGR02306 family)